MRGRCGDSLDQLTYVVQDEGHWGRRSCVDEGKIHGDELGSVRGEAAVGDQSRAGDPAGVVGEEEGHGSGDVLWGAKS